MQKIALLTILITLTGCWKTELTVEQKALISQLANELQETKHEIATINPEQYSGGLLKALSSARLEILKTNQALIEQRVLSIESGSPVTVASNVTKPDEGLASSLATEIASLKAKVEAARADAARYNGGLLQIVKLSVASTHEQSLALLEQKYLIAKYGLAQPVTLERSGGTSETPSASSPAAGTPSKISIPPADGPLGLAAGLNASEIEGMSGTTLTLIDETQSLYSLERTPKPNNAFERFALVISPTAGLCQIRAIGKSIDTNAYGHQLQSSFEEMREALTSVYGRPETYDRLMNGSLWKNPDNWMMGLYKKDRILMAEWNSTTSSPLKNNLSSITMEARAPEIDEGYFVLQYDFTNNSICEAEEKSKRTGSL